MIVHLPAEFMKKRNGLAVLHLSVGVGVVALGGVAAYHIGQWWAYAAAYILVGAYGQSLYILQHEAMHRLLFSSAQTNDRIGSFLSAFIGTQFFLGRAIHMRHHKLVGTPGDPNEFYHNIKGKAPKLEFARFLLFHLLGGRLIFVFFGFARTGLEIVGLRRLAQRLPQTSEQGNVPVAAGMRRSDLLWLGGVQIGMLVFITLASAWWVYFAFYLLPLATLTAFFETIRSFSEHVLPGREATNEAERNRRFFMNGPGIELFFVSQHDFHYHHVHHLYPNVPTFNVRRAHFWLMENDPGFAGSFIERPGYFGTALLYFRKRPVPGGGAQMYEAA